MIRRDALREYSRGSLSLLPVVSVGISILLGAVLSRVDVGKSSPLAFQGTADDARSLLIGISSTMVTVIALLLGLAVVALQLSSTQFSPRLLRNFLRDRPNQIVLSVFVGTFGYSAAGLFEVGVASGQRVDEFPRFAVTVAVVLLFVSLALLVFFADHLAHSIQVDNIMRVVEQATLPVIAQLPAGREAAPVVPAKAVAILSAKSGYVQTVAVERLIAVAVANGVNIRLRPRVGEHVAAGTPLGWVWPIESGGSVREPEDCGSALAAAVRIGMERTLEQDPGLGMRQLIDCACKALSPAVNDPYTAIQAIEHLSVLFAALAARPLGDQVAYDRTGTVAIVVPARSFAEHLGLGVGLIRRYGVSEPTVACALLRLLGTVSAAADNDPVRLSVIEHEARLIVAGAEREVIEPADLDAVHAAMEVLHGVLADEGAARTR